MKYFTEVRAGAGHALRWRKNGMIVAFWRNGWTEPQIIQGLLTALDDDELVELLSWASQKKEPKHERPT